MTAECLIDTNVLVYAANASEENARKKQGAIRLIESLVFGLPAQVPQEFYVTVNRKLAKTLSPKTVLAFLDQFEAFSTVPTDFRFARNSVKYQIFCWDGAILAAAERLDAWRLYSEDLNHGQRYGHVTIINPFGMR